MEEHTKRQKKLNKNTKRNVNLTNMQKSKNCSRVGVSLCTTVVRDTAQSSSDYLLSYPPDKHQSSDTVCWRGGAQEA